jgi:methyl-accepting chemotaxis protein
MLNNIKKIGTKVQIIILLISVIIIILALLFSSYTNNNIKEQRLDLRANLLKSLVKEKLAKKTDVGLTNAVGFSANGKLIQAIVKNNREDAIAELKSIGNMYKNNTNFKGIKVHLHTNELKSFVRSWKLKKFGDDLSSFRHSIKEVQDSKKAKAVFELGKSGMFIRGIVPIIHQNNLIGSLEFMQGVGSVNRDFIKEKKHYMMLLNPDAVKVAQNVAKNEKIGDLYVSNPKWFKPDTVKTMKKIDFKKMLNDGYYLNEEVFATYLPLKDYTGKLSGYHVIAEDSKILFNIIEKSKQASYIFSTLIIAAIIFIFIAVTIAIRVIVVNRITKLNEGIITLKNSKDTSSRISITSDDEIGNISNNFNQYLQSIENGIKEDKVVIEEAQTVINRVKNGWYSQHIESSTSNPSVNQFKESINEMIRATKAHFQSINKTLEQYAHLNYTNELKLDGIEKGGVLELLVNDINKLKDSITTTLIENKQNGLTLQESSNTLLSNVDTLNTSSNEAAASLEETAAALEEVTSNISNTTNNIIQMSSYATELTQSASAGESLANQTTEAMDNINQEVSAINEAITVIDQIAFQTNILSLNAAVEAATAGEAGKGFAVVAQEVRNLASRSAEAANEIKSLVESATQKANQGKDIADKMIDGYHGLNNNISKTIELINDVEGASKEQQAGIVQINDAVNALDRQTQQNASVANATKDIAVQTQSIAVEIVKDADEKEFNGKNSVTSKKVTLTTQTPLEDTVTVAQKPKIEESIKPNTIQAITSNDDADEWASF